MGVCSCLQRCILAVDLTFEGFLSDPQRGPRSIQETVRDKPCSE